MRNYLVTLICLLCSLPQALAQMSDEQVVEYIKTEYKTGTSQETIARHLLAAGATPEQMQRIKQAYTSEANMQSAGGPGVNRLREPNGDTEPSRADVAATDSVRKIFGHDIFRSAKLSFQSNINIPAPQSYLLGPGDEVILDIYGATQLTSATKVAPDGSVTIPDEGPVYVAGLTLSQAQAKIRKAIGSNYTESQIKVSLGQTRTILVNVMGEVCTPGTYSLSAFSTVFNALYLAGGVNEIGTLRNIKVSRRGRIVTTIDVYEFILHGRLPGNIMLQDDDVIIVGAYESLVRIEGNVKRPMYYEMKRSESLQTLLSYAGGFTGGAYKDKIRVERRGSEGLTVHNVDESDFTTFHNEDEDVVVVAPIIERYKNTVKVSGAVFRPGNYKIGDGVNTIRAVIEQAGGLTEQAVTSRAVLLRLKSDRTLSTQTIPLADILDGVYPDIPLHNEDELIISSFSRLARQRKMSIYGEVMNPGMYDYSDGTTLGDLITMAGGLSEEASLQKVEVARRITSDTDNSDGNQIAKVFIFNLDSDLNVIGRDDFVLLPFDRVTVHRSPNHKPLRSVYIAGEIMYEGQYTLSSKNDRLSQLVTKAGGITGKGYPLGAKLVRRYTDREMQDRKKLLVTARNAADSLEILADIARETYLVGINMDEALAKPGSDADIVLEEGDSIFVPRTYSMVRISGEVMSPNTVSYKSGKGARYYINQAGGISQKGKRSKAYILYTNGQMSSLKKGKIEPGCEIVIPSRMERRTDTARVSMWATLASTAATVGAVISTILR